MDFDSWELAKNKSAMFFYRGDRKVVLAPSPGERFFYCTVFKDNEHVFAEEEEVLFGAVVGWFAGHSVLVDRTPNGERHQRIRKT